MKECQVCSSSSSKYKCAKCRVPYCCVKCYSTHKDICAGKEQKRSDLESTNQKESHSDAIIPIEHLQALDKDSEIQVLLRSKRLAEHILMIDDAGDRPLALKRLRDTHPEFNGFVTNVLRVVNESTLHAVTKDIKKTQVLKEELQALIHADKEALEVIDDRDDESDFEEQINDEGSDFGETEVESVHDDQE
jgi:hypothetical protein